VRDVDGNCLCEDYIEEINIDGGADMEQALSWEVNKEAKEGLVFFYF